MKRHTSSHSQRDDKLKPSRGEHRDTVLRSRTAEERQRRLREWMIEQELESRHEKLKAKMIREFEIRRAREKGSSVSKGRCNSPSKSRSKSPPNQHRRTSAQRTPKVSVLSEKLESSNGTTPLFKGPEGTKISATELRKIKVDIHRNIPGRSATGELQRDILNPEDVVLKRRAGEGSKPIFEREEIKRAISETEEVEEHRTVVTVNIENSGNKSKTFKRHSAPSSPTRTRSHSPKRTSSRHSRYEDSKHEDKGSYRGDREKDRSRDRSRERKESYKERDRRHTQPRNIEQEHLRERKRDYSQSREREQRKWDKNSHLSRSFSDDRSYRDSGGRPRDHSQERRKRDRPREHSRERRERDRSRERRVPPQHYIEQIPVPIYYGNFPPRPIMVGPLVPIRGQVPLGGNRHPPMMGPLRPFPPRFMPPDVYRLRPPPNPRFGPMF